MLNIERLEATIVAQMRTARIPGLALAIIAERELRYARGFGVTSTADGGVPVTADTLFRIGSISKALTATLIMRLVEAGDLDLDVPVTTYIPRLRLRAGDPGVITLRTLMSMTSGLVEGSVATCVALRRIYATTSPTSSPQPRPVRSGGTTPGAPISRAISPRSRGNVPSPTLCMSASSRRSAWRGPCTIRPWR